MRKYKQNLSKARQMRCRARCRGFCRRQIQVSSKCQDTKTSDTGDEARSIHQVLRSYRGSRNFLDRSTQLSMICQDCDKKKLKSSTDSQVSRICQGCLKIVFQEGKNINMNAIKHATQPRIQLYFKLSKSSLKKTFKHNDPKNTHTHTLNKSNQFYISKISQDSLVSIH